MKIRSVLPRDAIPSIDTPEFGSEYIGDADDEVIVVEADPPRAYPIRILSYHEIANDSIGGRPIAVTWCPICGSGVVYDRTVDGRTLTFGMSGKLADDALVMYDRETGSEWKQPTGTAIAGELRGKQLSTLPSPIIPWEQFKTEHPDGVVLRPVRGIDSQSNRSPRDIYDMKPYEQYVQKENFGLYAMRGVGEPRSWDRTDLDAKTVVLGIEHAGEAMGYPIPRVDAEDGIVTDSVGGLDIVVFTSKGGIHAFTNPGFAFTRRDGVVHADGTTWDPVRGTSADSRLLDRVPARRMFAFAWQDAHGASAFY